MGLNQIVKEQIILSSGCKILTDFLVPHEINGWNFHQIIELIYFFIGRTEKPAMIPTNVWQFLFCQDFTTNIFLKLFHQCCWHVIRKVIWYVTKLRIFKILCNIYFFSSSCLCTVLAVSVLYFKKIRNRLHEYSKIRNFVTYQITFLMTCQQHKSSNI